MNVCIYVHVYIKHAYICIIIRHIHSYLYSCIYLIYPDRAVLRTITRTKGASAESEEMTYLPVNVDRLIWNAQRQFRINTLEPTSLHPRTVLNTINRLCKEGLQVRVQSVCTCLL